ncbi:LOW QUALITY PROTEIN: UPF0182 protein [Frankliniella fusca]|uniref:UPF0182 protein n=1 Tax=Frankliniella fusca TaxID=407009 RepID=A0AAE1L8I1_9NEOP|nr:LOW QUALITY PROTEIN: UPF0182 protein [Frankliniella fusca]
MPPPSVLGTAHSGGLMRTASSGHHSLHGLLAQRVVLQAGERPGDGDGDLPDDGDVPKTPEDAVRPTPRLAPEAADAPDGASVGASWNSELTLEPDTFQQSLDILLESRLHSLLFSYRPRCAHQRKKGSQQARKADMMMPRVRAALRSRFILLEASGWISGSSLTAAMAPMPKLTSPCAPGSEASLSALTRIELAQSVVLPSKGLVWTVIEQHQPSAQISVSLEDHTTHQPLAPPLPGLWACGCAARSARQGDLTWADVAKEGFLEEKKRSYSCVEKRMRKICGYE